MTEQLYTPAQAAKLFRARGLSVTERSVQRYCKTGQLAVAGRAGASQMYLIARSAIDNFTPPRRGPKPRSQQRRTTEEPR